MTNINVRDRVWKVLDSDPSIQLDLERGIINLRALARFCSKSGIDGTEDALLSAIRRYPVKKTKAENQAEKIIRNAPITTRSDIVSITLKKIPETYLLLHGLFSAVDYEKGETLRMIQSDERIKIWLDGKNLNKILEIVPRRLITEANKGLAEISLRLNEGAEESKGVTYRISGELYRNGINLYEIMSCVPEIILIVKQPDLIDAHKALFRLCRKA